jgi:hypothetical protein
LVFIYTDIDSSWINTEIETLISNNDKLLIQKHCYPNVAKFDKKLFNRSMQELFLKSEKLLISEDSQQNLKKVLSFIHDKIKSAIIKN